jgi:hypothetical protein
MPSVRRDIHVVESGRRPAGLPPLFIFRAACPRACGPASS